MREREGGFKETHRLSPSPYALNGVDIEVSAQWLFLVIDLVLSNSPPHILYGVAKWHTPAGTAGPLSKKSAVPVHVKEYM